MDTYKFHNAELYALAYTYIVTIDKPINFFLAPVVYREGLTAYAAEITPGSYSLFVDFNEAVIYDRSLFGGPSNAVTRVKHVDPNCFTTIATTLEKLLDLENSNE